MPHVLFVQPHPLSQRPFLRALERLGARITGIGSLPPAELDTELRYLLDDYEHLPDPTDAAALAEVVARVQARGPWVDHLETTLEAFVLSTAKAREATAIPGEPSATVALTQDKWALKRRLASVGVGVAPHHVITDPEGARAFAASRSWPLIVKPRFGSGLVRIQRVDDPAQFEEALASVTEPGETVIEEFAVGHEGFFDSLVVEGQPLWEAATHFYPPVLEAMRNRLVSPIIVHTNRVAEDGYDLLRAMNRQVIGELGLGTTATHLEWFHSDHGHWFSEMGLYPPPFPLMDLFSEAADEDLYLEWARAVVHRKLDRHLPKRAAGLVNLRPDRDGQISHYEGVETMQRRYGELIFRMHLPPPGTPTQPIADGYLANAWVCLRHPNYDELRAILADVGETVKVFAH